MQDKRNNSVALALYHAAVGKIVLDYVEQIDSEAVERAMERRRSRRWKLCAVF